MIHNNGQRLLQQHHKKSQTFDMCGVHLAIFRGVPHLLQINDHVVPTRLQFDGEIETIGVFRIVLFVMNIMNAAMDEPVAERFDVS